MQLGGKTGDRVSQNTQLIEDIHFSEAEVKTNQPGQAMSFWG